ncbi:MAG: twin-arginine translocase TatA/TatE family subunit [Actinobacteria bacterium]|nr:twin-arginine translocase TatA/TatE family subunit [Actinomycetota bacterium]MBV8958431.1 twin-arginine translocase TatA/TatE family subunit [Actinomycetota bacterium]MBV9254665.1 twin-arginine translocase TatA/TatE family subunit [Actinomycetota bacterium]MBV9664208.1 twin-arginine translocase TatA/TatE family subunit [Actinomycetota bacterium]
MLVIGAIIALLFGSSRLPVLARSLGTAKKEFENGMNDHEPAPAPAPAAVVAAGETTPERP